MVGRRAQEGECHGERVEGGREWRAPLGSRLVREERVARLRDCEEGETEVRLENLSSPYIRGSTNGPFFLEAGHLGGLPLKMEAFTSVNRF
jgi:hypothetical protein